MLPPSALTQVYIGPPAASPLSFLVRYCTDRVLSASLVAMPIKLVSTIQNRAPGPPSTMAVTTPMMFPVPMVTASSVVSAENEDTFPFSPPDFASPLTAHFSANLRFLRGKKCILGIR